MSLEQISNWGRWTLFRELILVVSQNLFNIFLYLNKSFLLNIFSQGLIIE